MYKKVLVTTDGSELAKVAIPHAARLAVGTDAEVIVLEVSETLDALRRQAQGQYEFTDGEPGRIESLAKEWHFTRRGRALEDVEVAKGELQRAGVANVRTVVAEGFAGNEIVDVSEQEGCDAIVMATRGHGGLGREVVGSVAEYVLRNAGRAAVVFVGPRARE